MLRRRKTLLFAALISGLVFLLWPSPDWVPEPIAELEMKCFEETEPISWTFCLNQVAGSQNLDIVYYFHGRNGAATWWNDRTYYTGKVHQLWKDRDVAAPTVVSVSFGKLWLLTERSDETHGGLLRVFQEHVIPTVEHRLGRVPAHRLAVGESMGGVNALLVGLKSGPLFSKVAALCPPVPTVSPYASADQMWDYVKRSGTSWKRAGTMLLFSRGLYPSQAMWLDNNPVSLAKTFDAATGPRLYLSCGRKDEWGCLEGSEAIISSIEQRGGQIEWHPREGGHCDVEPQSLAEFLVGD